jgi:hypothetical protein
MDLEVGEAPALVQIGEVARELHGVRIVDPDPSGGGVGRRRARPFLRALAWIHAWFSRTGILAHSGSFWLIAGNYRI